MNISLVLSVFLALSISTAYAQNENPKAAAVNIKTEATTDLFEDVALLSKAHLPADVFSGDLTRVSQGLRKKAIFGLIPVDVYVLQFLAAQPSKLTKNEDDILKSLKDAGPVLLQITFKRTLKGSQISDAFKDGLKANGIKEKALSPSMEQVLSEIANITEFKKNDSFLLAASWNGDKASLYLQENTAEAKVITGTAEFVEQFLSIWFGIPSDGKLRDLKKELMK